MYVGIFVIFVIICFFFFAVLKRHPANINLTANTGFPFTLNCPIFSIPPANVTWFYGNVSLSKIFNENRRVEINVTTLNRIGSVILLFLIEDNNNI